MSGLLDLDAGSRQALEYDAILEELADLAATPEGAERLRAWTARADRAWIAAEHQMVDEMVRLRSRLGTALPQGLPDSRSVLRALRVEGLVPDGRSLRGLAQWLQAAAGLRAELGQAKAVSCPGLRGLVREVELPEPLWREILGAIGPEGELSDEASPALARLRRARRHAIERLRERLEGLLRDRELAACVQDEFVTERQGRFVIPCRADGPRRIPGIVHARSSSGATLFVEPLEVVEANNEIVELAEQERAEVQAVLRRWSDALRAVRPAVERAVEMLVRWDTVQARARFAERYGAICPQPGPEDVWELQQVRHPRLEAHRRERGTRAVPLSVAIEPPRRALVLSGPNAGGKTVALKTIGLAVLLFQSGIPVPARAVRLPVVERLRADIGDHQSIDADLSTFSAHVAAVARFLREAGPRTLVLLDEPGSGTEPAEGAALAQAVLESFVASGATTIATTHQARIKQWALAHPQVLSAAMDFDVERLEPTYTLVPGAAGISAGLEIAARLGLPEVHVARARALLDPGAQAVESELRELRRRLEAVEHERRQLEQARRTLEARARALAERAAREREVWRQEAERKLQAALAEARELLQRERAQLAALVPRDLLERRVFRATERIAAKLRAQPAGPEPEGPSPAPSALHPGARVRVRSLGREGEIVELAGLRARVRLGQAVFSVAVEDLCAVESTARTPPTPGGKARVGVRAAERPPVGGELVLVGQRVAEALEALDRFLDRAVVAGLAEVRVVHGHGSGRLREGVRRFLAAHALVASQRPGDAAEGGEAVTIVSLHQPE